MKGLLLWGLLLVCCTATIAQKKLIVAKDGSGNYTSVQQAINAVPDSAIVPVLIFIKKGIYKEKIVIPAAKTNVMFIGEDENNTILTYDDYALKLDSAGKALGTGRTASVYVYSAGFTAKNITFENSSGPAGQALAIYVVGNKASFFNCRFLGFQDTIYTHGNGSHQYYSNCYIEGTTDFIFGAATALFDKCNIFCKKGGLFITAASTLDTTKYGYVFKHCKITGNAPVNTFALGRPWRPYAKVVYLYCNLSDVIKDTGWNNWQNPDNEKTAYYAEYKNFGSGAKTDHRVTWSHQLTDKEAEMYTERLILKGWEPKMP